VPYQSIPAIFWQELKMVEGTCSLGSCVRVVPLTLLPAGFQVKGTHRLPARHKFLPPTLFGSGLSRLGIMNWSMVNRQWSMDGV